MASDKFNLKQLRQEFQETNKRLPKHLGTIARNFFQNSWRLQGFQDSGLEPWQTRKVQRYKRRGVTGKKSSKLKLTKAGKYDKGRAILVKTGDLRRSIKLLDVRPGRVVIGSDLIYADVHNSGLRAGRGSGFQMPRRQFVGDSAILRAKLRKEIERLVGKAILQAAGKTITK